MDHEALLKEIADLKEEVNERDETIEDLKEEVRELKNEIKDKESEIEDLEIEVTEYETDTMYSNSFTGVEEIKWDAINTLDKLVMEALEDAYEKLTPQQILERLKVS